MRRGLLLAGTLFAAACGGPIAAPPGVVDLRATPGAFRERFDRDAGVPRLVLLLSPG